LRYFNACGSDPETGLGEEHQPETHLIPLLLRAVTTGKPITIFGDDYETPDGTCSRDYVHVTDLAEAHVVAIEKLLAGGASDVFNVGTGMGQSVLEIMRAVEKVTGQKVPHEIGARRAGGELGQAEADAGMEAKVHRADGHRDDGVAVREEAGMNTTQDLTELQDILSQKSVRFGQFTLTSGKTSDVYVDCKPTTCYARAMPLIGRLFLRMFAEMDWAPEAVGGLTLGADPIAFAIARQSIERLEAAPIDAFVVRKERKPHGMQKLVEGLESTEGRKVVIIDDVCTQGGSTATAIRNAQSVGMEIIGAGCLIDREAGASEILRGEFGIELASIFKLSNFRT
jgi:orotate phosphoribosyltransferase